MGDIVKLIGTGAEYAGLGKDLEAIEAIRKLVDGWAALDPKPLGKTQPGEFLKAISNAANADAVKDAFARLGLTEQLESVKAFIDKLAAKVPAWVDTLMTDVNDFTAAKPGNLEWNPLKLDEKVTIDKEHEIVLGASATAGLGITAFAAWPGDPGSAPLMLLDANGSVGLSAGGTVKLPGGALSVSAEAGATAKLDYYYKPGTGLYVFEVAKRLAALPNPFNLDAVWDARQGGDFAGLRLEATGKASAGVTLKLAYSGIDFQGMVADLSAELKVGAKFDRSYTLTVRPGTDGLYAVMHRNQLNSASLAVGIKVEVAFPVLAAKIQKFLTSAVAVWDKELKTIQPLLSPGTWLQKQAEPLITKTAEKLIANETLRKAVTSDLQGAFGIDTGDTSDLVEWLTDALHGAIDSNASKLIDKADAAGTAASDAAWKTLVNVIPSFGGEVDAAVKAEIEKAVKDGLADLVKAAKGPFEALLKEVLKTVDDGGAAAGKALGKTLKDAGALTDKAVATLDDLLKGVREALERYNEILHDVTDKAKKAVEQKVSIAIHFDNEHSRDRDVNVAGTFGAPTDASRKLFRDLAFGDLDALAAVASGETVIDGFKRDEKACSSKLTLLRKGSSGVDIMAFGVGGSFSMSRQSKVEVEIDGFGNLQIDAQGKLTKRFSGRGQEREVSFADSISLAASRTAATAAAPPRVELGVSVIYKDEDLTLKELTDFTGSLKGAGLISEAVAAEALKTLTSWQLPKKAPPADMWAKLWFEGDEIVPALCLAKGDRESDEGPSPLKATTRRRVYDCAWDQVNRLAPPRETPLKRAMDWMKAEGPIKEFIWAVKSEDVRGVINNLPGAGYETLKADLGDVIILRERLHGLIAIVDQAGQAYRSTPAGTAPKPGDWTPEMYLKSQDVILTGSREWLATGAGLIKIIFKFWSDEKVHPRTLALMAALNQLAGTPAKQAKLTLVNRTNKDAPVTVMIAPPAP